MDDSVPTYISPALAAAVEARRLPIEFALLRHEPAPYTPVDALAWFKAVAFGLAGNWECELVRARLVAHLGPEKAARLEPLYHEGQPLAVDPGSDYTGLDAAVAAVLDEYQHLTALTGLEVLAGGGIPASNNWAVAPRRSTTGRAILCNDPHLPLQSPGMWYLNHLTAGDLDVAGAAIVGSPGVILGHNQHIAWGVTNAMTDMQDLYLERFHPDDPTLVLYEGRWERATVHEETIRVRGRRRPVIETLLVTRHGPVLCADWASMGGDWLRGSPPRKNSDAPPTHPPQGIALRWSAHEPGRTSRAVSRLNHARDWTEFTAALRDWTDPALNFAYADDAGNIGYYLAGRLPVRARGQGLLPLPGWDGRHEWTGVIPFDELPHTYNPDRGFLVTANNRLVGADYPYYLTHDWNSGYRARRITQVLQTHDPVSLDDCAALQTDVVNLPGRAVAHLVARRLGYTLLAPELSQPEDPKNQQPKSKMQEALAYLAAWDGAMGVDSVAATLCEYFLADFQRRVFGVVIADRSVLENYIGASTQPVMTGTTYVARNLPLLIKLLAEDDATWLRAMAADPVAAADLTWEGLLHASLEAACERLRHKLGPDMRRWQWGRVHTTRFVHPLGRVPLLARYFDGPPVPTPGGRDTVNSSAVAIEGPQPHSSFGAGFRSIFDPGDWDAARVMVTPGHSGHPASAHYHHLVGPWLRGEYIPLPYSAAAVAAATVHTLTLHPPGEAL
jgi:penicillin amidase